ncbi:molybdenum cofactor guanylyltransferase MobA [Aquifex sp.]
MKCFILAGGRSRRFGEDKLLYEYKGKRVIERVVQAAKGVCDELFIVAKDPKKFEFLGIPVIVDALPVQASIVGLYTALSYTDEPALILSGDLPLITPKVLKAIVEAYESPITLAKTKNKVHTLVGVYSPEVLNRLEDFIKKRNYRLYEFVSSVGFKAVELGNDDALQLLNMNTKEDLKVLEGIN